MKKLYILVFVLFVSACSHSLLDVSYDQMGGDCVYTENAGRKETSITGKKTFYITASKTITYPNTLCSKIIEGELKAGTNKHQTLYSRYGSWHYTSGTPGN